MLEFSFFTDCKMIPSVNAMYSAAVAYSKGRKPYAYLYKPPEIKNYQEFITNIVENKWSNIKNKINVNEVHYITSLYIFGLPKESWMISDTSNLIKITEDAVFNGLEGFNDKMVVSPISIKVIYPVQALYCLQIFVTDFDISFHDILQRTILPINKFFCFKKFELI